MPSGSGGGERSLDFGPWVCCQRLWFLAALAPLQERKCCEIEVLKSQSCHWRGQTVTGAAHGALGRDSATCLITSSCN